MDLWYNVLMSLKLLLRLVGMGFLVLPISTAAYITPEQAVMDDWLWLPPQTRKHMIAYACSNSEAPSGANGSRRHIFPRSIHQSQNKRISNPPSQKTSMTVL